MGLLGPCNCKNIHRYLYCLRNITNSSRVQPDQTGHLCSNSFRVLKPKYNQEYNNIIRKFWWLLLFMWRWGQQKATNCMLNKQIVQLWNNVHQHAVEKDSETTGPHPVLLYKPVVSQPISTSGFLAEIFRLGFYSNRCTELYLAKTVTVVRRKEFPFPSVANYANSPVILIKVQANI